MNRLVGVTLVIISAAAFGTLAIIGHYAYAAGFDTLTLLCLRFGISTLLIGVLLAFRGERLPRGKSLALLIGMGAIGYFGQSFCFLTAIKYASAGLVALLLYLYPTFVVILSALFLKKKITRLKLAALGLATLGIALTVNPQGGQWIGILLALSAALIYAVYIMVGSVVMQKVSAIQSSTVIFASAGAVFGMLIAIRGPSWPTSQAGWLAVLAIALIATVIPVVTFLAGLKRIGPTDASMLSTFEPVVTILLAALLLGESLQPATLLGGGLILAAVLLITYGEIPRDQSLFFPYNNNRKMR